MTSRTSFSLEKLRSYLGMALAVAAGGALGALLRWALSTGWTSAPGTIAWSVLLINVVGSALLGVVTVSAARRLPHRPAVVAFLGTGLLGGFTTFSTVMVLSLQLANEGHPWLASLQVLLNVLLSVLAAVVAMFCTTLALDKRDAKRGLPTELSMDSDESAEEVLASDGAAAEADDRAADASGAEAGDGVVTAEAAEATEATEAPEAPEAELYPAKHAPIEDLQDDDSELFTESYDAEELLAVDRAVRADQSNHTQAARQDSRTRQAEPVAHRASAPAPMVEAVREPQPVDAEAAKATDTTETLKTPEVHKSPVTAKAPMTAKAPEPAEAAEPAQPAQPAEVAKAPVTTKAPQAAESAEPTAAPAKDVAPEPRAATTRHASPAATPTSSPRAGRHSHAKPRPLMANGKPEPELYLPDLDFDSEAFAFPGTAEFPVITFDEDGEVASRHSRWAVPEGQAGTVTDLAARLAAAHATENEEDK